MTLNAKGMEQRGKGATSASVVSHLEEVDEGTKVSIEADLTISGAVAQYGRGMILDISQRLTGEFAKCLEANMSASPDTGAEPAGEPQPAAQVPDAANPSPAEPPAPLAATATPVEGFRLGLWAFWRAVARFFRRLFGSGA